VSGKPTGDAESMPARAAWLTTPVGRALCLLNDRNELLELKLAGNMASLPAGVKDDRRALAVQAQLDEYFAGTRTQFDLPLAPRGTEFQQKVWQELLRIPYGQTVTYSELATRLGDVKAVRAVGRANGANPIWLIIPCHRVVGADGSLTGYAAGIEVKRYLLELEGARQPGLFDSGI
jgi:methylated-DNA-[protein]-cysteine S-methyltransferase